MNISQFIPGLKPLRPDKRDYSHSKTFGSANVFELPLEYSLVTTILNQGSKPLCTAEAACAAKEAQSGIQFNPDWFYDAEGQVNGLVSNDGYDLRVMMRTGCKKGFKPLFGQANPKDNDPANYEEDSFFACDGGPDLFDSIRSAMWLGKDEKRCALIGTMMYREWLASAGGIVLDQYPTKSPTGLHAMKVAGWTNGVVRGWKNINGQPHLILQNSYGTGYGDNGLLYFPRAVVNKEFEGAFAWRLKPQNPVSTIDYNAISALIKNIEIAILKIAKSLKIT